MAMERHCPSGAPPRPAPDSAEPTTDRRHGWMRPPGERGLTARRRAEARGAVGVEGAGRPEPAPPANTPPAVDIRLLAVLDSIVAGPAVEGERSRRAQPSHARLVQILIARHKV